jgi:hypothetical protein
MHTEALSSSHNEVSPEPKRRRPWGSKITTIAGTSKFRRALAYVLSGTPIDALNDEMKYVLYEAQHEGEISIESNDRIRFLNQKALSECIKINVETKKRGAKKKEKNPLAGKLLGGKNG